MRPEHDPGLAASVPAAWNHPAHNPASMRAGRKSRLLRSRVATTKAPIVPVILFYAVLLPVLWQLHIGPLLMMPYRVALLALSPFLAAEMMKRPFKPLLQDYLFLFGSAWFVVAMAVNTGFEAAVESGGSWAIDTAVSYLIGRVYLRNAEQFRSFLKLILPGISVFAILLAAESISHVPLFPNAGGVYRLGLLRARGTFPHSILAGLFLASWLPLYFLTFRGRVKYVGTVAALFSFFTISSAAMLMLGISVGALCYRQISHFVYGRTRWLPLLSLAAAIFLGLEIFTQTGAIKLIIKNMTFDPWTGIYRTRIWEYGSQNVLEHPLFGNGYNDWARASWMYVKSVDNEWLLLAMQFGIPNAAALGSAFLVTAYYAGSTKSLFMSPSDRRLLDAFAICFPSFFLMLWTVAYWNNASTALYLVMGAASSVVQSILTSLPAKSAATRQSRSALRSGEIGRQHSSGRRGVSETVTADV